MNLMLQRSLPSTQQGSVILEALIAILIFSMGILAVVGLQAAMVKNTSDAKYRSDASYIAQQRIGTIWADPGNATVYLEAATDISALLPNGTRDTSQPTPGEFMIVVTWSQPGDPTGQVHNFTTIARIAGG